METKNNSLAGSGQANNFFSGFLLGALVGAAIVFLLGTKKGKRIWKAISEDGLDNISNLLDKADKTEDLDEVAENQGENIAPKREFLIKEEPFEKPKVRRFFRGIPRHVN